jgi:hypothetical protein
MMNSILFLRHPEDPVARLLETVVGGSYFEPEMIASR